MMKSTRLDISSLAAAFVLSLVTALPAQARWSDELTTHMWDTTNVNMSGPAGDCAAQMADTVSTPGRPAGGWYEFRFTNYGSPALDPLGKFAQFDPLDSTSPVPQDATRACPRTFNEYTMNHHHGVTSARLASFWGQTYAVYDTLGNYYGRSAIKLQQDPSVATTAATSKTSTFPITTPSALLNNQRPYSVVDLTRNARGYIQLDPGSVEYEGRFDYLNDGIYGAGEGCMGVSAGGQTSGGATFVNGAWRTASGAVIDNQWFEHSGYDHEKTFCGAPAFIQTLDPDIDIRGDAVDEDYCTQGAGGRAFVTWIERYVEGKYTSSAGVTTYGFDARYGSSNTQPNWFPNRRFVVHVEDLCPVLLAGGRSNTETGRVPHNALTSEFGLRYDNVNTNEAVNAFEPRVTQVRINNGPVSPWGTTHYKAVVAWAEATFSWQPGEAPNPDAWGVAVGSDAVLLSRQHDIGTQWGTTTTLGTVCNTQRTSSGRASGRKMEFGGTHDIATFVDPATNKETPIVVMTQRTASACTLQVRVRNAAGTAWTAIGGDVRHDIDGDGRPSWPRITVVQNVPYITWVETAATGSSRVFVKRWNGSAWQELGDLGWTSPPSSPGYSTGPRVRGASIAVLPLNPLATTGNGAARILVGFVQSGLGEVDPGVWTSTVRMCDAAPDSAGAWRCVTPPAPYQTKAVTTDDATPAVYRQSGHLGVAWATPQHGQQLTGYAADPDGYNNLATSAGQLPGAVDLVVDPQTIGDTNSVYFSYPGTVQNHRNGDQGLFVRKDSPLNAERAVIGLGNQHTVTTTAGSKTVYTWGDNSQGQLGLATISATPIATPQALNFDEPVKKVEAGATTSGALTGSGKLYLWGSNAYGQLCAGNTTTKTTPLPAAPSVVAGTPDVWVDFALGGFTTYAVRNDGTVWACGYNVNGEVGNGNTASPQTSWQQVTGLTQARLVDAGYNFACALRTDASAWCWGNNISGQLGRGTTTNSALAAEISGGGSFTMLALGYQHALAYGTRGGVQGLYAWGRNASGELGLGHTTSYSTAQLTPAASVSAIWAAGLNSYYRMSTDSIYGTGADTNGELDELNGADPTTLAQNRSSFVFLGTGLSMGSGAAGYHRYLVSTNNAGTSVDWACWGRADKAQCMDQIILSSTPRFSRVAVPTPSAHAGVYALALDIVTQEDTPVSFNLAANNGYSFEISNVPSSVGSITTGTGSARTFTPAPNYFGQLSFNYVAISNTGERSTAATVRISVQPVNDAPHLALNSAGATTTSITTSWNQQTGLFARLESVDPEDAPTAIQCMFTGSLPNTADFKVRVGATVATANTWYPLTDMATATVEKLFLFGSGCAPTKTIQCRDSAGALSNLGSYTVCY